VSREDLRATKNHVVMRRVVVTKFAAFGRRLGALKFLRSRDVTVTRVARAGAEFIATPDCRLLPGDTLSLVGGEADIAKVSSFLGNPAKAARRVASQSTRSRPQ
jgi:putative transport protein